MKTVFALLAVFGMADALKVLNRAGTTDSNNDVMNAVSQIVEGMIAEKEKAVKDLDQRSKIVEVKCSHDIPHIQTMIEKSATDIEEFASRAEKGAATAAAARSDIAELQETVEAAKAKIEKDNAKKQEIRSAAKAKKQELNDTMMALTNAIAKLESTASSFIQLPKEDQATVLAFTQGADLDSSTGDLINTLKDARDEFRDELQQLTLSSDNEVHSLEMSVSANQGEVEASNNHISDLDEAAKSGDQEKGEATANGVTAKASKADSEALLKATQSWCNDMKKSLKGSRAVAAKNLLALQNSKSVLHPGFIQLSQQVSDPQNKVLAFLAGKAKALKSKSLAQLVSKAEVSGQFDKVLNMIHDMIKSLKSQGNAEEKQYIACQNMKSDNRDALNRAENAVAEASGEHDDAKNRQISSGNFLSEKLKENTENEENWQTIKADTTSDVQTLEDENTKDFEFEKTLKGASGRLPVTPETAALREIIDNAVADIQAAQTDRNNAISKANTDLDEAEQQYKITKAQLNPTIADAQSAIADAVADQSGAATRLEEGNVKLAAAQKVAAEISNQCDAKPESHEAKVQRYEDTITSLKEALEMLA